MVLYSDVTHRDAARRAASRDAASVRDFSGRAAVGVLPAAASAETRRDAAHVKGDAEEWVHDGVRQVHALHEVVRDTRRLQAALVLQDADLKVRVCERYACEAALVLLNADLKVRVCERGMRVKQL